MYGRQNSFDDGVRTYIKLPAGLGKADVPKLFLREHQALVPVGFQLQGNAYIVNRILAEAELHGPDNQVVHIRRQK